MAESERYIERRECGRCGAEVRDDRTHHFCGEPYPLRVTDDIRVTRYVPEAEVERLREQSSRRVELLAAATLAGEALRRERERAERAEAALRELAGEYGCTVREPIDPSEPPRNEACRDARPDEPETWCYACVASAALASVPSSLAEGDPEVHCCEDCKRPTNWSIGSYWLTHDKTWARVVGDGSIMLCPSCFEHRARAKGVAVSWFAVAAPSSLDAPKELPAEVLTCARCGHACDHVAGGCCIFPWCRCRQFQSAVDAPKAEGRAKEPWEVLRDAPSVTELPCECENPERGSYTGRDGFRHCEQCDGRIDAPKEGDR